MERIGQIHPARQTRSWWAPGGAANSEAELAVRTQQRLIHAIRTWGYIHRDKAQGYLGEESFLFLCRQAGGWERVCRESDPENLAITTRDLTLHLWAVRCGSIPSFATAHQDTSAVQRGLRTILEGSRSEDAAALSSGKTAAAVLTGRDLAWKLAELLHGDPEMTPIAECGDIVLPLNTVEEITRELREQWRQTEELGKSAFKRILIERLKRRMQRPAGPM